MGNLVSNLTQPTGRSYVSFLRRNSDELYWNVVASEFQALNLDAANNATRAPFHRVPRCELKDAHLHPASP